MAGLTLADSVLVRIREEMLRKGLNQRDLADQLGWSQSRLGKILTGRTALTVNDMEQICIGIGLPPVQAVRDQGLEFVADMTPTELRIHERIKQIPKAADLIMGLLDVRAHTAPHTRRAGPARRTASRSKDASRPPVATAGHKPKTPKDDQKK